jgi:heterodisulfide reductase subunit A
MSDKKKGTVLVIGGGVAGMTAAIQLGKMGHEVHIIEREPSLGGLVAKLGVAPEGHEPHASLLGKLRQDIEADDRIKVQLSTKLVGFSGKVQAFKAEVESSGKKTELNVGAVIIATGAAVFDPHKLPEYRYGKTPSIVTNVQFDTMLTGDGPILHPATSTPLKRVGFVQCVGSRMETRGNPWCSHVCCVATLKHSLTIKERSPETDVLVYYMDIRAFDRGQEEVFTKAKAAGVRFFRGIPAEVIVRMDDTLLVRAEDASLGKVIEREMDLMVLATGLEPSKGTANLVKLLGIPGSKDGFVPVANPELRPCCTGVKGIVVAGSADFPKFIKGSALQARAAAHRVDIYLSEK